MYIHSCSQVCMYLCNYVCVKYLFADECLNVFKAYTQSQQGCVILQ